MWKTEQEMIWNAKNCTTCEKIKLSHCYMFYGHSSKRVVGVWHVAVCLVREYEMAIFHFERVMVHKAKIWISQVVFSPRCTCPGPTWACNITTAPAAHEVTLQACLQCEMLSGWNHPKRGFVYWEMGNTTGGEWRSCLASLVICNTRVAHVSPEVWKAWELPELFAFPFWVPILAIPSKLIIRTKKF